MPSVAVRGIAVRAAYLLLMVQEDDMFDVAISYGRRSSVRLADYSGLLRTTAGLFEDAGAFQLAQHAAKADATQRVLAVLVAVERSTVERSNAQAAPARGVRARPPPARRLRSGATQILATAPGMRPASLPQGAHAQATARAAGGALA